MSVVSAPTAVAVLEHLVRSIVDQPDAVSVSVTDDGGRSRCIPQPQPLDHVLPPERRVFIHSRRAVLRRVTVLLM